MKKIITILILIFTLNGFSQQPIDSTATISTAERIIDKYGGKAVEGFNTLVEKATPIAEQGFTVAVKLQIAKGISELLPILFFIMFLFTFTNEYNRINAILNSDNVPVQYDERAGPFYDDNINPKLIAYLILTAIFFILAVFHTYSGIAHLVAPEWFAIQDIVELIK